MTRVLLVGHGRLGKLIETHASEHACTIVGIIMRSEGASAVARYAGVVDVAIDVSAPDAVRGTVEALAAHGINVVIGTTGWQSDEARVRAAAERGGIGVLAASNFSIGLHVFRRAVAEAARAFAPMTDVGAWIHEAHHSQKKDAPSGTALTLRAEMERAGYGRTIDVSSSRAGAIPGTHTVGFDGPSETVTMTHTVRDRAVFAHGALDVARWLVGRRGWYGMDDFLNDRGTR